MGWQEQPEAAAVLGSAVEPLPPGWKWVWGGMALPHTLLVQLGLVWLISGPKLEPFQDPWGSLIHYIPLGVRNSCGSC